MLKETLKEQNKILHVFSDNLRRFMKFEAEFGLSQ